MLEELVQSAEVTASGRLPSYYRVMGHIDRFLAVPLLAIASPFIALGCLMTKIEMPRETCFYRQQRYGQDDQEFEIYKIRTMPEEVPTLPPHQLSERGYDGRRGYVGRFLDKTRINELPQLVNVLKGEMRLVGPRPPILNDVEIVGMRRRTGLNRLKPGLTFIDRVYRAEKISLAAAEAMEMSYLQTTSLYERIMMDAKILLRTIPVALRIM